MKKRIETQNKYITQHEKILIAVLLIVSCVGFAMILTPNLTSFGMQRLPDDIPLLRELPTQPQP